MSIFDYEGDSAKGVLIVYDGHCPFCQKYVRYLQLKANVGQVVLQDARQSTQLREHMLELGFDLDKGMVVKVGGDYYTEGDAMHVLALLSSKPGWRAVIYNWVFRSKRRARALYPLLRFFRNLILRILHRPKFGSR